MLSRKSCWTGRRSGVIRTRCLPRTLLDDLKKVLSERMLNAEIEEHLERAASRRANRGHFPNDAAAMKLYVSFSTTRPKNETAAAAMIRGQKTQFAVICGAQ